MNIEELDERLELLAMELGVYKEKLENIFDRLTILSMEVKSDYEN